MDSLYLVSSSFPYLLFSIFSKFQGFSFLCILFASNLPIIILDFICLLPVCLQMRAGGLACALLLLASGASHALPQYGGASSQQQQQEGQVGQQQQQEEEGGFWWQDKGVFESQVSGGRRR